MTLVEVIGDTSSRNCTNRSARTFDNVDNMTHRFDKGRFTILYIIVIMLTTSQVVTRALIHHPRS